MEWYVRGYSGADRCHSDDTGGQNLLVRWADAYEVSEPEAPGYGAARAFRFRDRASGSADGEGAARDAIPANARPGYREVRGAWIRLVGRWGEAGPGGISEQVSLFIETKNVACDALYLWHFPPEGHQFAAEGGRLVVYDKGGDDPKPVTLVHKHIRRGRYEEFASWRGWVVGRWVIRNPMPIRLGPGQVRLHFATRLFAPGLASAERRRAFRWGVVLAVSSGAAVQLLALLAPAPYSSTKITVVYVVLLVLALVGIGVALGRGGERSSI